MPDEENTHSYTRKLDDIISELRSQRPAGCNAMPDVVREHTAMLHEMRADLKNINRNLVSLGEKFETHVEVIHNKVNGQGLDINALKTEKKTAVAVVAAVASALWSALTWYVSIKGGK